MNCRHSTSPTSGGGEKTKLSVHTEIMKARQGGRLLGPGAGTRACLPSSLEPRGSGGKRRGSIVEIVLTCHLGEK